MHADYVDVIRRRLAIPPVDGPDKVTTLDEAVRRLTAPGQTIFLGAAHGRPNALVRELVRQWWGRRPGWTLGCTGFGSPWTSLSSMEEDNARDGDFVATDDPFGGGGRGGLVRAFPPDAGRFHAGAAGRGGDGVAAATS